MMKTIYYQMTRLRMGTTLPRRDRLALALALVAWMMGMGVLFGRSGPDAIEAEGAAPLQETELPTSTTLPTIIYTIVPPTIPPGSVTPLPTDTPKVLTHTPVPTGTPVPSDTPAPSETPTTEPATATPTGPTPTGPTPTPADTPTPTPTGIGPPDTPRPSPTWTSTPTAPPTNTPSFTATPTPCAEHWTIAVWGYIDTVGKGPYSCPGCDGNFRDGDRYQASYCPLAPLRVIITPRDDPTVALVDTFIEREHPGRKDPSGQDIRILFSLCAPPPYRVQMITEFPPCYSLCPNTPPTRIITQRDFDFSSGRGRKGAGRYIQEKFGYWRCGRDTVPTPAAVDSCAIHPEDALRSYPDGRTSIGNNGGFEAIGARPGSALWWRSPINAIRVPGNLPIAYPSNGTLGIMQLAPQGPLGTSGIASISNDVRMPAVSPPTSNLGLDVHWRVSRGDPATASFTLTGNFGGTTFNVASSDPASAVSVPRDTWQRQSVAVTPVLRDGIQTLRLDLNASVGVEVYIDTVDLDFCYQEPTPTPTNTPVPPSPTPTNTATDTPTPRPSVTPTDTPRPSSTPTNTPVPPSPTPTNTPPTPSTATPTNTPVPPSPTPTNTPVPPSPTPTNTLVPPSPTPTNTLVPPSPTPTNTPVPPSPTPTNTPPTPSTATPTNTPVPPSPTPTNTPVPPSPTPTNTPIVPPPPSPTPTNTPVPPSPTPTNTPVPPSPTPTNTPIVPPPSPTPTNTPVPPSPTPTNTPVPPSPTPTKTPGPSPTPTNTRPPGPPPTPRQPEERPPGGCPDGPHSCLRIIKYHDVNANGLYDDGDKRLPDMPFEIIEERSEPRSHRRDTDRMGEIVICFDDAVRVSVHELLREMGGTWTLTTGLPDHIDIGCDATKTLEIGNAPITRLPETGRAEASDGRWRARRMVRAAGIPE